MKTFDEVARWCDGAAEQYGDPSLPVCQLFFRWCDDLAGHKGDELVCGVVEGELTLLLGAEIDPVRIRVAEEPTIGDDGVLEGFAAEAVTLGVWALNPSLNMPGEIHAFIVIYGVPNPPPWGRRLIIAGSLDMLRVGL